VVAGAPGAVEIGEEVESIRPAFHGRGNVGNVVVVALDGGADHRRLLDAVGVHLPQQLLDAPSAVGVRHGR